MTISLQTELSALQTESKRRHADVKAQCDRALSLLQKHDLSSLSEAETAIITQPFILGISTGNAKITTVAIPAIHKIIVGGVVSVEQLPALLDGLREASALGIDIQLRILQCLPALLQMFPNIQGANLKKVLGICATLTMNNKPGVVINTASATLQQLFSNVFDDKRESEKIIEKEKDDKIHSEEANEQSQSPNPQSSSPELVKLFSDLVRLVEFEAPEHFAEIAALKTLAVLEIIENVVSTHTKLFHEADMVAILRKRLVPALLRILSSSVGLDASNVSAFPLVCRAMRLVQVLLSQQIAYLEDECEVILSFFNHMLSAPEEWQQAMVLELYRGLFANFLTIKTIFERYDSAERKKDVLRELLTIFGHYMNTHRELQTKVLVAPTSQPYLSRHSALKMPILDHLDKQEPPQVPRTYRIFLICKIVILLADGIAGFVQDLSANTVTETLEADVDFTNDFIASVHEDVTALFQTLMYTTMDGETFHLLVRSLQRFTHATGLLGMAPLRDGLLKVLARAIVEPTTFKSEPAAQSETGKQLLALGESIAESFGTSIVHDKPAEVAFNSRHVTCLRALTNLAVSLGTTLGESWRIVWITFQWCDYYLNGADEYSASKNEALVEISATERANIDNLRKKLFDSVADYPQISYGELISVVMALSEEGEKEEEKEEKTESEKSGEEEGKKGEEESEKGKRRENMKEEESEKRKGRTSQEKVHGKITNEERNGLIIDPLLPCPFNTSFYSTVILKLALVDSNKFLMDDTPHWAKICAFFTRAALRRQLLFQLRLHFAKTFNAVVDHVARTAFEARGGAHVKAAEKTLTALEGFVREMFALGDGEQMAQNCETQMHLFALQTLHGLVDKYDAFYQDSWDTVFEIVRTLFQRDKGKIAPLVDLAFNTMKLILDEFVGSLPYVHLRLLIDTLSGFCAQKHDLNILFSLVHYFWLVSDSLRGRIERALGKDSGKPDEPVNGKQNSQVVLGADFDSLAAVISSGELYASYVALEVYLLHQLVALTSDLRPTVRDGAIQTFFQIIDAHGPLLTAAGVWSTVYSAVLTKLFVVEEHQKDWVDSLVLVLQGLVEIYKKFFKSNKDKGDEKLGDEKMGTSPWRTLISYLKTLLSFNISSLDLKVFAAFNDLVHDTGLAEIRNMFLEFWTSVSVEYDFVNAAAYQERLTAMMKTFPQLYVAISDDLTVDECTTILGVLSKCAKYPVLPSQMLDNARPSQLQAVVVDNLRIIDPANESIQSAVAQQLSQMAVYPFGLRERIERKLSSNLTLMSKVKVPTFEAMGRMSMGLLVDKLAAIKHTEVLVNDGGAIKITKALLQVVAVGSGESWGRANEILRGLLRRLMNVDIGDEELWKLAVNAMTMSFNLAEVEHFDERLLAIQYRELVETVMPRLVESKKYDLVNHFIETLYASSYLYAPNVIEIQMQRGTVQEQIRAFSEYDFDEFFGTTEPLVRYENTETRFKCLRELIRLSRDDDENVRKVADERLTLRAAFAMRRFVDDQKLLGKCPMSKIQKMEMEEILGGLQISGILGALVVAMVPYSERVTGLVDLMKRSRRGERIEEK